MLETVFGNVYLWASIYVIGFIFAYYVFVVDIIKGIEYRLEMDDYIIAGIAGIVSGIVWPLIVVGIMFAMPVRFIEWRIRNENKTN